MCSLPLLKLAECPMFQGNRIRSIQPIYFGYFVFRQAATPKNRHDELSAGCTTGSIRIRCPNCDPYFIAACFFSLR